MKNEEEQKIKPTKGKYKGSFYKKENESSLKQGAYPVSFLFRENKQNKEIKYVFKTGYRDSYISNEKVPEIEAFNSL